MHDNSPLPKAQVDSLSPPTESEPEMKAEHSSYSSSSGRYRKVRWEPSIPAHIGSWQEEENRGAEEEMRRFLTPEEEAKSQLFFQNLYESAKSEHPEKKNEPSDSDFQTPPSPTSSGSGTPPLQTTEISTITKSLRASQFAQLVMVLATALCLGCIVVLGWFLKQVNHEQKSLADAIIQQERVRAEEMLNLSDNMTREGERTRAFVANRLDAVDDAQSAIRAKQFETDRKQEKIEQKMEELTQQLEDEKNARQHEMTLLLNLTRVRMNNLERRQEQMEGTEAPALQPEM